MLPDQGTQVACSTLCLGSFDQAEQGQADQFVATIEFFGDNLQPQRDVGLANARAPDTAFC